ncbi:hypothetical protein EMCRGX_G023226 [Ephydatia muelleri]
MPVGPDTDFDSEKEDADVDTVCTIRTISLQLNPTDQGVLAKESAKDPVIANVIRYTREGWPPKASSGEIQRDYSIEDFRKLSDSLSMGASCTGHFGIQRMKQLARTVVYWPKLGRTLWTNAVNAPHVLKIRSCQTRPQTILVAS